MSNSATIVTIKDHQKDLLKQLNECRISNNLCDATVVVQGREFVAHRAILAASGSGFFNGVFTANMKERSESKVELNDLDPDALANILSYIYTGDIELSKDNAQAIAMAADFLLLDKLKVAVDEFLAKIVHDISSDFVSILQFAVSFECPLLEKAAMTLILKNFEAVFADPKFLELSEVTLLEIIACDGLVISSEEVIFRAVVDWVKHEETRKSSFYQLFTHVRLCSLSEEFLHSSVVSNELVLSNPDCWKLVLDSMKIRCLPTTANVQHPRSCLDAYTDAILVFPRGVHASNVAKGPCCYIPSDDTWHQIPIPGGKAMTGYGLPVYHEGSLLLVRSAANNVVINRFGLKTNTWLQLASFPHKIEHFNVVCCQGKIYFVGGCKLSTTGQKSLAAVYSFDATVKPSSSLNPVSSMKEKRRLPSLVSDGKFIYALGGGHCMPDGQDIWYLRSVERYDPKLNSWVMLSPMINYSAKYDKCIIAGNKIYRVTVGHHNEVYDIHSDTWAKIPRAPIHGVRAVPLALCDDKIYFIAFQCDTKLYTLSYSIKGKTWSSLSTTPFVTKTMGVSFILELSGMVTVRLPKTNVAALQKLKSPSP